MPSSLSTPAQPVPETRPLCSGELGVATPEEEGKDPPAGLTEWETPSPSHALVLNGGW